MAKGTKSYAKRKVAIGFDEDQFEMINKHAKRLDASFSDIVRRLIRVASETDQVKAINDQSS